MTNKIKDVSSCLNDLRKLDFFKVFFFLVFLSSCFKISAQNNSTSFGLLIKPVIPSSLFTNTLFTSTLNNVTYTIEPIPSVSFGGVMRFGLKGQFTLESGIHYTQRNYDLNISSPTSITSSSFKIVDYEIPILGVVFIRLGEKAYLNTAFGLSLDFFPNDIAKQKDSLLFIGKRVYWLDPALIAQTGFEYRTEKNGFFYIGGAYHRMFSNMYALRMDYTENNNTTHFQRFITGSYFAVELKWFFPNNRTEPDIY